MRPAQGAGDFGLYGAIAFDIREAGRRVKQADGSEVQVPGKLKSVKGIGWFIEEYGIAQLSLNLTDIDIAPMHIAFDEACKSAQERGIRVTGSELVGLVPKKALLDAADFYLARQQLSLGISEREKIKIAVKSMGLDDLAPFDPEKRVIEYLLADAKDERLVRMDLKRFSEETAAESPAPGGGSVATYCGALGAALGTMVANLSAHKRGWDERWEEFSQWAVKGEALRQQLIALVDEDTRAFDAIMAAMQLPKGSPEPVKARKTAIDIPFGYYQGSSGEALRSSIRIMKESGGHAVKLEGGSEVKDSVKNIKCRRARYGSPWIDPAIDLQVWNLYSARQGGGGSE